MDLTEFSDIAPFNDEEAAAALARVSLHPATPWVSKYIFPNQPETYLRDILQSIHSVDEFQSLVMSKAVEWVIKTTVKEFTYNGLENIKSIDGCYLAMSNHRDIILDPACSGRSKSADNRTFIQNVDKIKYSEIAGAEILTPLRNAVRLIHSHH